MAETGRTDREYKVPDLRMFVKSLKEWYFLGGPSSDTDSKPSILSSSSVTTRSSSHPSECPKSSTVCTPKLQNGHEDP